jgi:hypothetical protein
MRTTITLDPDVAARLKQLMRERGISFKQAVNAVLRAGFGSDKAGPRPYRVRTHDMGLRPDIDLDKALRLADALEDEELIRKLQLRK